MTRVSILARRCAKAVAMALVATSALGAPAAFAGDNGSFFAKQGVVHGNWQGGTMIVHGKAVCGATTHMGNGGTVTVFMTPGLPFLLSNDHWSLTPNEHSTVVMTVATARHEATAVAVDRTHLAVVARTSDEQLKLSDKTPIVIDMGELGRWTLDLDGIAASMQDGFFLMAASGK